jgi:hypothetical protein
VGREVALFSIMGARAGGGVRLDHGRARASCVGPRRAWLVELVAPLVLGDK